MITILVVVAAALILTARRRRRHSATRVRSSRGAALLVVSALLGLSTLIGTPAMAQPADDTSCAPFPERPGAGMAGAVDPPQGNGLRGGENSGVPYTDKKFPNSPYRDHGYAGMIWHVYDPNCNEPLTLSNPSTTIDTWAGKGVYPMILEQSSVRPTHRVWGQWCWSDAVCRPSNVTGLRSRCIFVTGCISHRHAWYAVVQYGTAPSLVDGSVWWCQAACAAVWMVSNSTGVSLPRRRCRRRRW